MTESANSPTTNGQPSREYLAAIAYTQAKKAAKQNGLGELWAETEKTLIAIVSSRGIDKSYGEMYARRILPRIIPQDRTSASWTATDTENLRSALSCITKEIEDRLNTLANITYRSVAHCSPGHYTLPQPKALGFEGDAIIYKGKILGKILAGSARTAVGVVRSSVGTLTSLERQLFRGMHDRGWRMVPPRMALEAIDELEDECGKHGIDDVVGVIDAVMAVT